MKQYQRFIDLWNSGEYTPQYCGFVCGMNPVQTHNLVMRLRRKGVALIHRTDCKISGTNIPLDELAWLAKRNGHRIIPCLNAV